MSSTYTGDKTAIQAPSAAWAKNSVTKVTLPSDGDALNAASVEQPFKLLGDLGDVVADLIGWLASANTWTEEQVFNGATGDAEPAIRMTDAPTNFKLWAELNTGATALIRFYAAATTLVITWNAVWDSGTTDWVRDAAGNSSAIAIGPTGISVFGHVDLGAGVHWAHGNWGTDIGQIDFDLNAGTSLQVRDAIEAVLGDITATAGDVVATAGNLVASAGDPDSDQARARIKQIVANAAAKPTGAAGAAVTGSGGAGTVTITNGSTDTAGDFDITVGPGAGADAPGNGVMATITLNKSYPVAPRVVLTAYNNNATSITFYVSNVTAAGGGGGQATFDVSTTSVNLTNAMSMKWSYHVIGTAT